ncbi:MAG TPA: hypothetical protein VLJ68_03895 [Chitinophagaceae bacterium]|nr:hypothetical protein [Chitinophagaceae bacterium]
MRNTIALFSFVCLLVFPDCKRKSRGNQHAQIITGKNVSLANETISINGGIVVDKPGDPLNGLSIDVPADSFVDDEDIQISYANIESANGIPYFNPITPLINISSNLGFVNRAISINVPIKLPPGHFAMPFLYNAQTGELEGLAFGKSDNEHIEILTQNLSGPSLGGLAGIGAKADPDISYYSLVVSSIDIKQMSGDHITPFRVKQDNFQFTNWGSYIAPEGHCSGQTMGMLWYYHNKKLKGSPALFGLYDNDGIEKTPDIWEDDVLAYTFCSVIQNEWTWSTQNNWIKKWQSNDQAAFWAFTYAIMVTNEPQLCIIFENKTDNDSHAILVYGTKDGQLLVVDPNFPREERHISYDPINGVFAPYLTGRFAGDAQRNYPYAYYFAKSSVNSWTTATEHWKEVENKTIGKGIFPDYTIVALNDKDEFVPLEDGFTVPLGGSLTVTVRSPGNKLIINSVFNTYGDKKLVKGTIIELPPGDKQRIGLLVSDLYGKWAGFKWVDVNVENTVPGFLNGKGKLKMELTIDGEAAVIEKAEFIIDHDALNITGYGPKFSEGAFAYPYTVEVYVPNFHGKGEYTMSERSNFWQYGSYSLFADKPSTVSVYDWVNNEMNGVFEGYFISSYGKMKRVFCHFSPE